MLSLSVFDVPAVAGPPPTMEPYAKRRTLVEQLEGETERAAGGNGVHDRRKEGCRSEQPALVEPLASKELVHDTTICPASHRSFKRARCGEMV